MISYLIPNKNEIVALFSLIFLVFTFYSNGYLISKKKDFNINFVVGWSLFSFVFILFGAILKIKLNYIIHFYTISSLLIIIKNFKFYRFIGLKKYFFLIPIFFLFLNSKSHGWDSFAFILDRTIYLLNNNEFPISQFRSNYPFSSTLIHYYSNFYTKNFTENIPALFDLILIIGSIEIFYKLLSNNYKLSFSNLIIILCILIFFNPMIMNVYSFSSYEDLHVAYIILVIFYFNFENDFDLNKLLHKKNTYIMLIGLLSISKATGFIHSGSILLSNFLIFIIFNNLDFRTFKNFIFLCFASFFQFFLWQYYLLINDIFVGNSFKGFRLEIFKNIIVNYYNQFLVKKLLIFSNFIFMFAPLFTYWVFKDNKINKMLIFISIPVFIWNFFHLIFFIFIQGYSNAIGFHNFFRYLSQFSLVFTAIYIIIVVSNIKPTIILIFKNFAFGLFLKIIFFVVFFLNFYDFRRDLSDEYKVIKTIHESKKVLLYNNKNYSQLDKVILNFYTKNKGILFK
jgi:hypothetical protein